MEHSILVTLGLGFALGLKHATEADHLAAVSTIVSERRSIRQSAIVGGLWGVGHTASLLAAALLVVGLGFVIPERVANLLELAVALMIVILGTRLLYVVLRGQRKVHVHAHTHNGRPHMHLHFHGEQDAHTISATHEGPHTGLSSWRPLLVGMMHGLAGSAALTVLVLAEVTRNGSAALGLAYILVFGIGSIGGMLVMSCLIGLPFSLSLRFSRQAPVILRLFAGAASTAFGFFYAWGIICRIG